MERHKLIARLKKLLAMAQDSSSPAEAAIAARRMEALMIEYDVTLEEITDTGQHFFDQEPTPYPSSPPMHKRRTRASSTRRQRRQSNRRQSTVQRKKSYKPAFIVACGTAAVASWLWLNHGNNSGFSPLNILNRDNGAVTAHTKPFLHTEVARSSIVEGEHIVLHVTGALLSSTPNTSSLIKDFKIIDTQVKSGANTKQFQAFMKLQPRKTGMLHIPSFYADGVKSKPIIIDVVPRKYSNKL